MISHRATPMAPAVLVAALLALTGCPQQKANPVEPDGVGRFSVERVPLKRDSILIRTDTATGQAWSMRLLGQGIWQPYTEGKEGVPSPDGVLVGRYSIKAHSQRRGAPNLVRLDSVTGRIWRTGSMGGGYWVPVAEADPTLQRAPEADGKSDAEPEAEGAAEPETEADEAR